MKDSFAGNTLENRNDLDIKILEQVLISIVKGKDSFVTPESFMVRFKAPRKNVRKVLDYLVKEGILHPPLVKNITEFRKQTYYYFKMNSKQAIKYAEGNV